MRIVVFVRRLLVLAVLFAPLCPAITSEAQTSARSRTQVVLLGTGNPRPTPETMGPSVAIIVNGSAYLVDAGVGMVRRAAEASTKGVNGLEMPGLSRVFLTHLHSDHTLGLPDLIFTPWIMRRTDPLQVWGPPGTQAMTEHILQAWSADLDVRLNGMEHGNTTGYKVIAHDIQPGVVFQDTNVKVTAFAVPHGSWKQAFGYRFDTPDRSIVLSGDTSPSDAVVAACNGCDVLLHEVYSELGYTNSPEDWRTYSKAFHTTTTELAGVAARARPKLLVLYHQMYFGGPKDTKQSLLAELKAKYKGRVVSGSDLDIY